MEHEAIFDHSDPSDEEQPISGGLGTEIAALFKGIGLDIEIPELRDHDVDPVDLEG
jgi:hypothetical protein